MKQDTLKRIIAYLLLGAMVLGLLPLAALAAEDTAGSGNGSSASIGIIGGADGPTAIFVTGNWGGIISTLFLIAGSIFGIIAVVKILKKCKK